MLSLARGVVDEGEQALINQGFGPAVRAAYRVGQRYPRYAGRLLRKAVLEDSPVPDEARSVISENIVPAFEGSAPEVSAASAGIATEAVDAAEVVSSLGLPEVGAAILLGGGLYACFSKLMAKKGGMKKPSFKGGNFIHIGLDRRGAKQANRIAAGLPPKAPAQYKPVKIAQPVSTGEVIKGALVTERSIRGGVKVNGREVIGVTRNAASANFTLVGAFSVTPLAYPGSRMGNLSRTYAKYNIRRWDVRVVTSAPTTADGQILTYFHHNRHDPVLNWTSTGFITTVLSARNSVVGPKWSDSHLKVSLTPKILESSFPIGDGHMDLGAGDVFVFVRSATAHSFIVLCDYEIDFTEPQITSRINLVPFARAQWFYCARNVAYSWTLNSSIADLFAPGGGNSKGADGTANGDNPVGNSVGDIYRFVCDLDNSIFVTTTGTTLTNANAWDYQVPDNSAITVVNGTTVYCVFMGSGQYRFFPTLAAARLFQNPFRAGLTGTGNLTICGWMCLVDSMEGVLLQSST